MKAAPILPFVLIALFVGGCMAPKPQPINPNEARAISKDLQVTIALPSRSFVIGQTMKVTVTARNNGENPIHIESRSSNLVTIQVFQKELQGWQQVKHYPQAGLTVLSPWALAPGQERTWQLNLPIEPDWPTGAPVRIKALLNGADRPSPEINVRISPK